jgi:hypothetical protein
LAQLESVFISRVARWAWSACEALNLATVGEKVCQLVHSIHKNYLKSNRSSALDWTPRVSSSARGTRYPTGSAESALFLKQQDAPEENAITVGNTSYFPRALSSDVRDLAWLMHELTHQWQYQHLGIRYLLEALRAPTYVYADVGEPHDVALKRLWNENKKFSDFSREQQGDIVRDYFLR